MAMRLRIAIVVGLVVGSMVVLLPSFVAAPWFPLLEPAPRIDLGIALQGGTELVLEVDVDSAFRAEVDSDVDYLRELAVTAELRHAAIRRIGTDLVIESEASGSEAASFVGDRLSSYTHVRSAEGAHQFQLTPERRAIIRKTTMARTIEVLEQRVADRCSQTTTVDPAGGDRIRITTRGDPSCL